jgi:deoxyribodipyrimidine photo-lyase
MPDFQVPAVRIRAANDRPQHGDRGYVLYWMIAFRRPGWNFSLQRAVEHCRRLKLPLVVLEALRCDYRWASPRLHQFVVDGMRANARRFTGPGVTYYPYLERSSGEGRGLLRRLSANAAVVVTDDFPCFFLPQAVAAAARQLDVRLEAVDSNGILPLRCTDRVFTVAHSFRRHVQHQVLDYLSEPPVADPLSGLRRLAAGRSAATELATEITQRWPRFDTRSPELPDWWRRLPLDWSVEPVDERGGCDAAERVLEQFVEWRLEDYDTQRNEPSKAATSGLSPYLHFGHISSHQVVNRLLEQSRWSPQLVAAKPTGSAAGWWGATSPVEAFLDQVITWRELGYNMCSLRSDYDRYESLPPWALATLAEHARDRRPQSYTLAEFEAAATHDPLWNAAQRQLVREGRIHNYLRMLWGKKILHWSATPQLALEVMIELNNKYALDGRNPNSYSGIFWTLGRYDRPWGPERPIFGKVRYMTSENTARKVDVDEYLRRYA